jgi:hypothetical protein
MYALVGFLVTMTLPSGCCAALCQFGILFDGRFVLSAL